MKNIIDLLEKEFPSYYIDVNCYYSDFDMRYYQKEFQINCLVKDFKYTSIFNKIREIELNSIGYVELLFDKDTIYLNFTII